MFGGCGGRGNLVLDIVKSLKVIKFQNQQRCAESMLAIRETVRINLATLC
jgi:hypothetical protein